MAVTKKQGRRHKAFLESFSPHLFWDVNPRTMDPHRCRAFVIARAMERGSFPDVMRVWNYYGRDEIRRVLMKARCLDLRTILFFANQFDVSPESFRASSSRKPKEGSRGLDRTA